ncbi:bifunctional NAD(P)H-dependent oxidoreductase/GNAT family N-acetyltransferase [Nonomuraea wenchangensis]|uniref:NAD(P)H-dependent FMN reductase n=1 Tax=Nonomuraea wenchangensis TaxID=568860 RepID=A0A1I0LRQ2_9ACTN|nr:bifunctional NAD(P)H-dependent oxidoreductase/GNAT family N-acetyltransferase [Nonomuraea wenchangensis]SEU44030.1 NAD(P)H-dependent FMN reductase [Nonomuraea wenchangensis]
MSTKPLRIVILICSTRPGALGPAIGQWLTDTITPRADELGAELLPVSLADLALPFLDEEDVPASGRYRHQHTQRWSATVEAADGFIAVTPEYNYGMPAAFKNALDYLGHEWAWKPMGFVSYGNTSAGTRSVQHARQVVTTLRLVPLGATLALRIADTIADGRLRPDTGREQVAIGVLDELVRLAHALRPMRERSHPASRTTPLPGTYTRALTPDDAADVLVLQRCCWVEEALANDTLAIPALQESLQQVRAWLATWQATGLWRDGRLLGMVRTRRIDDDWHVGRLAVVPDLRGQGVGRRLLHEAEAARDVGCRRIVLSTGARSQRNISLYHSQGYRTESSDGATATLVKPVLADGAAGVRAQAQGHVQADVQG